MDEDDNTQSPRRSPRLNGRELAKRKRAAPPAAKGTARPGTSGENEGSDDEDDAGGAGEPAFAVRSKKGAKTAAETRNELVQIMQGRTTMLERMADAVAVNNNNRAAADAPLDGPAAIDMWSKITAHKVKGMNPRAARRFMLRVDTMAADELDEVDM